MYLDEKIKKIQIYAAYFSVVSSETPLCMLKHTRYKLKEF